MVSDPLFGRERLIGLVWSELLERRRKDPRELPVIALLGPRGSGKTAVLEHLADKCLLQTAQPFVPVCDLANSGTDSAWRLVTWLAWQLSGKRWEQFGRLRFPRLTLGRIVLMGAVSTSDLDQTKQNIESLLRRAAQPSELETTATDVIVGQLPQLLGLPSWVGEVGRMSQAVYSRLLMERLKFHSGMAFYGTALQDKVNGGLNALIEMSRLAGGNDHDVATVNRVLCEALLADLAEEYKRGFRPRNCLVLIDNVDDRAGVGKSFLTALTDAKTNHVRAGGTAPLLVVVTSRRVSAVVPLPRVGRGNPVPAEPRLRPDATVSRADWQESGGRPGSWLYPVRLTDLTEAEVRGLARALYPDTESWPGFVHSLTGGHPWGVREVLKAVHTERPSDERLDEHQLRKILDHGHPALGDRAVGYLLSREVSLPPPAAMPQVAAALDLDAATRAALAPGALLHSELADLMWLADPDGGATAELHRWPRRLLQRQLAGPDHRGLDWQRTYEKLSQTPDHRPAARYHYGLALGEFLAAVDWLTGTFGKISRSGPVTAASWIADFNTVTSAGHERTEYPDACQRHEDLVWELQEAVRLDEELATGAAQAGAVGDQSAQAVRELRARPQWLTILVIVVARWIWADPLGDPAQALNPVLANGFRQLAMGSTGERQLIAEAEFYHFGGRP